MTDTCQGNTAMQPSPSFGRDVVYWWRGCAFSPACLRICRGGAAECGRMTRITWPRLRSSHLPAPRTLFVYRRASSSSKLFRLIMTPESRPGCCQPHSLKSRQYL